jgi:hypothetical protein
MDREPAGQDCVNESPFPEHDVFYRLMTAARGGDWSSVEHLVAVVSAGKPPCDAAGLGEYLRLLREALVTAKAARAGLAASVVRLKAAAVFGSDSSVPRRSSEPNRQISADLTDS